MRVIKSRKDSTAVAGTAAAPMPSAVCQATSQPNEGPISLKIYILGDNIPIYTTSEGADVNLTKLLSIFGTLVNTEHNKRTIISEEEVITL